MELRDPLADRVRRWVLVVIGLVLAAAFAALYLRISEQRGASGCANLYAAAQTAADTALADLQRPDVATGRMDAAYNVSCGELRRRGKLP